MKEIFEGLGVMSMLVVLVMLVVIVAMAVDFVSGWRKAKTRWRLSDYLDVLTVLAGHPFVYFTSNKSSIIELCDWMGKHPTLGNPFGECKKVEFNATVNHTSTYTDIMLYKKAA